MPSPFPGMDPYLEEPSLWPDVHHALISEIQAQLNRDLRPKYHVRVEERIYVSDENDPGRKVIVPDPRVVDSQRPEPSWAGSIVVGGDVEVAEPIELTTLIDDEMHEARLEVIDREHRCVVTVIEILSPSNKVPGSRGRASYVEKRADVMNSPSHFVEIDLLRGGEPITARELVPPADYYVDVSEKARRPKGRVWPILLTQRLPVIPIPLRPEDGDAPLDLQQILAASYDRAAYDLQVDYRTAPSPPLPEKYRGWADSLLRSQDARD